MKQTEDDEKSLVVTHGFTSHEYEQCKDVKPRVTL